MPPKPITCKKRSITKKETRKMSSAKKQETITVLIESPKGYRQKFDYDPESGRMKLSKLLPEGLVFPFDFGMIPGTEGEDGDPLDIIVLSENGTFPGCLADCRVIGALTAEQTERDGKKIRNDRYIGISLVSQHFAGITTLADLPENILPQLEAFFENYNTQAGKRFRVLERLDAAAANRLLWKI
ncbi:inorganic diphosphatase [Mucilaginibacter segetis]|uniref:inorganic diphosphatase n=1 Tax=Mucilaginibacter segetis TaxID=2793071 RepID=A0A934PRU8_9SPHI|nr:inorganic diphosphatase [Mucilaginibacter segetis]MBK0378482.1 inorganic diphosphatase [Mucilaginibacter segetis]